MLRSSAELGAIEVEKSCKAPRLELPTAGPRVRVYVPFLSWRGWHPTHEHQTRGETVAPVKPGSGLNNSLRNRMRDSESDRKLPGWQKHEVWKEGGLA